MVSTSKKHIFQLAEICARKGIKHAVISPGSRSAPLVIAFNRQIDINCVVIPDERSAAFFALGMAQQTGETVALICTSGSALLNYAPAVAEAFYQKIPLLILSADRPIHLINQGENQCLPQTDVYKNFIKKSFLFPHTIENTSDLMYANRIAHEAIFETQHLEKGPVHINIPLSEPLYETTEYTLKDIPNTIEWNAPTSNLSKDTASEISTSWKKFQRKIIIIGALPVTHNLQALIERISTTQDVIILSEIHANIPNSIQQLDAISEILLHEKNEACTPDLIVTIGGGITSKRFKNWIKSISNLTHWHVSPTGNFWNTYDCLSQIIPSSIDSFLHVISAIEESSIVYKTAWENIHKIALEKTADYLKTIPFSDLKVFEILHKYFPAHCNIHYGNSSPIRYGNILPLKNRDTCNINANRGVSGIDGVVSTAAGAAYLNYHVKNQKKTICITGDISFFYDSNAWWNNYLNPNFICILVNNNGGNIFKAIAPNAELPELETYFETTHNLTAEHISKQYNIDYSSCATEAELTEILPAIFKRNLTRPIILEIKTPRTSADIWKAYYTFLSK